MIFRFGELFSGPGGIGLAANMASFVHNGEEYGIQHVWANDYDADTCKTYAHNVLAGDNSLVICEDIRKLNLKRLAAIDALAFGFPCNDFSTVGEQRGIEGNFGPLYSYGIDVLKSKKPKWFLAENVSGLGSANEGRAFSKILSDMITAGYTIYPHLYKFEEYGVPQARHRIIIIGIRKGLDVEFRVPKPTHSEPITAKEALENPPIPQNAKNQELTAQSATVVERLNYIKPGENAFNADIPDSLRLNVKGAKISQIYRRLHPEKPAYTVTGSGGGGTHIYHYTQPRALTNRERARLQSFPDDFEFIGTKESVRRQIGMAVPPVGAHVIIRSVLKCFAGVKYDSIPCNIDTDGCKVKSK
jgi:DNA (cytosine-5)-methyltransferase 1